MIRFQSTFIAALLVVLAASSAFGQSRPYIGFVYPAGGQQGTTVTVRLGGQRLLGVEGAQVSGEGVTAKLVKYFRRMSNQDMSLLREQLTELRREAKTNKGTPKQQRERQQLMARIQERMASYVNRPASVSIAELAWVEVTIAPDAPPGEREIRLVTPRGVTNPLVFCIGQVPEVARKAMKTSLLPVLGKEQFALRKRPPEEAEVKITVPCTMNGQIAAGEINSYRFQARRGQRLVISAAARQLIPYIADAVPGWFQPVLTLYDANGREVAYNDDYRFKPDPVILYEVPADGEYVLAITDALYRGREDFVYRITIGELPFVTTIFPLGGRLGGPFSAEVDGWNLSGARLLLPPDNAKPGVYTIVADRKGVVSNPLRFAIDTLPEATDREPNDDPEHAQRVKLPLIVNGRVDEPDDWDVYKFHGTAGQTIVAEVYARRLESPLDSMVKITDARGRVLAVNDDHEDPGSGLNTHHADSYVTFELPADGDYCVHLGDAARSGGNAYAYRLRISQPQPDFALRVVPSSAAMRSKGSTALTVHVLRKDGFDGPVKLTLKDPPEGFTSSTVTLPAGKESVRFPVRTSLKATKGPVSLVIQGQAQVGGKTIRHDAVPAEDRMQAFLWRHLVPAQDLSVLVFDPSYQRPATRVYKPKPGTDVAAEKPVGPTKFTKRQVQGRLRQLKRLYEEWLITDEFYGKKVAECEAAL